MVDRDDALSAALAHLREAIALLDEADAPAQIGAHVDLAAHQLQALLPLTKLPPVQSRLGNCQEG